MNPKKLIFQQTLLVCFCMNCIYTIGKIIEYIKTGSMSDVQGYIPISFIIVAFLTALPSVIFYIENGFFAVGGWIKIAIHYVWLAIIVLGCGYLLKWYSAVIGFIAILISYTIVYVLVWIVTKLIFINDAKKINSALDKIRDEE